MIPTLDRLNANPMPFARLMGIVFTLAEPEEVRAELLVRDELCTAGSILHGGAIMALADSLGAVATVLNLPDGKGTTTIESKTNFLGSAKAGTIVTAICTPLHKGARTQVWTTRIHRPDGKLVAAVTQTQMVL